MQGNFFLVLSGSAPIEISHKNVTTLLNCTAAIQLQVSDQEHDCDGDIFNSTVQKIRGYYEVTCLTKFVKLICIIVLHQYFFFFKHQALHYWEKLEQNIVVLLC